jgi:pyruvate dehydrogenase E1 component alpha subunit
MKKKKTSTDQRVEAPVEEFSIIPHETLLALYRNLLRLRMNGANGKRRPTGNAWPFDAATIAVAAKLLAEDTVIADAHNSVFDLLHGGTPKDGRSPAKPDGAAGIEFSMQLQMAVGAALAHKTKKTGKISVTFASNDRGDAWADALEVARIHRLPMVFVWNSNHRETNREPARRKRPAIDLEPGTELAQITADGNDIVAMYRVAHEAVERARRDRGPTLIECIPFRFGGSKHRDPIANMESYLRGKGLLRRGLKQELLEEIARQPRT